MATITERIRKAVQVFQKGYPWEQARSKAAPFVVWPDYWKNNPQWRMIDLDAFISEGFNINTLIYSAVMYKARATSNVTLQAYEGESDQPELLDEGHPLAKLVSRPNPNQSWREFQMLQTIYLNVSGDAFTWFDRSKSVLGVPSAMYSLHPQRVFIIPESKGKIRGYLYVPEGRSKDDGIPLLPADVSHVKLPNPGDTLDGDGYGFSPIAPLAQSGDVDNMITAFLKIFFERGAVPAGLLKFEKMLNDDVVARIKERWRDMYGGTENWSDLAVLDQGGQYERLGMNFDELGFDSLDERNESRILSPFGVPPILIGSRLGLLRSTYANYKEARQAFWEDTMLPEMWLHEDDYKYYMQSDDGGWVAFDFSDVPALRKDVALLVTAWSVLVDRGVPKNVASEVVGLDLPKLPDGEVIYMPLNLVPMGASTTQITSGAEAQPEATEDTRQMSLALVRELKRANDLLETANNGHK